MLYFEGLRTSKIACYLYGPYCVLARYKHHQIIFLESAVVPMLNVREVEQNIEQAVNLLKALSNERRLMIVCALYKGEKNVSELEEIVGLSQSALSQHLARLRRDRLVNTRRHAQTIFYSLPEDRAVTEILRTLHDIYCPEHQQKSCEIKD